MGLFFARGFGNEALGYSVCWIVDTGIYWYVWMMITGIIDQFFFMRHKNRG